jgi:hypothetical protein
MLPATGSTITAAILRAVLGKRRRKSDAIVVVEHQRVPGEIGGDTPAGTRIAEGKHPRAGLHQQAVGVAMVAALELDQQVAPGKTARQPDRAHRRFSAGTDQANHFERRQHFAQQFGHLDLAGGRGTEGESLQRRRADRGDHFGMRVPKNQRPPRANVIDVTLAVYVDDARTGTGGEKARRTANRTKGPDRRVDATRDVPLCALKKLLIAGTHKSRP